MTDLHKAATMAVKALERADKISGFPNNKNTLAALREALAAPVVPEMHDALCPALTGRACTCSQNPMGVDKAWAQFCGGIGRGPNAPYPGMIDAFEAHYGQSFTDKDWRTETGIWAAAWKAAIAAAPVVPPGYALVPVEPTPEMVAEYLKANDAYWRRTDELPTPPDKWRTGKPSEATAESYRAMLAAAPKPKEQT